MLQYCVNKKKSDFINDGLHRNINKKKKTVITPKHGNLTLNGVRN